MSRSRETESAGSDGGGGAGRLIMAGLEDASLSPALCDALRADEIGGLILFRRDFESLNACAELIARARSLAPRPLLFAIDEEGGFVSQIDGLPLDRAATGTGQMPTARGGPSPASLGEIDDESLTGDVFQAAGEVLRRLGFDLVFAPLADVNVRPDNPIIGRRSFGSSPDQVSRHVVAALRGLRAAGLHACVKHFPGHGAASADSHLVLPTITGSVVELPVFRTAFEAGVPAVMTAHVHYPALDPVKRPATRSPVVLNELLRTRMGFEGVVVSDALEMKGFDDGTSRAESACSALAAGVDLFLVTRGLDHAHAIRRALAEAAEKDPAARARLDLAVRRVEKLSSAFLPSDRPRGEGRTASGADIRDALARVAPMLRSSHERATRRLRAPATPLGKGTIAVLLPRSAPAAYLDPTAIERALIGLERKIVTARYGPGEPAPPLDPSHPGACAALCVYFVRGSSLPADARAVTEELEAWRQGTGDRSVVALWAADHLDPAALPPAWGVIGLTGSHASAFEAASIMLCS